jgi:hypothetical protein
MLYLIAQWLEFEGLATVARAVELGALVVRRGLVEQPASVVHLDLLAWRCFGTGANFGVGHGIVTSLMVVAACNLHVLAEPRCGPAATIGWRCVGADWPNRHRMVLFGLPPRPHRGMPAA